MGFQSFYDLKRSGDTDKLIGILRNNEDPEMRKRSAKVLSEYSEEDVMNALVDAALNDDDPDVRKNAGAAIAKMDDEESIKKLVKLSKNFNKGRMPWPAVNLLIEALEIGDTVLKINAARALGRLGSQKAVKPLINTADDDDPMVRKSAILALGMIGDSRAAKYLEKKLDDDNEGVRRAALDALHDLGRGKGEKPFLRALKDDDDNIRAMAVRSLGEYGQIKHLDRIASYLDDDSEEVRESATWSLIELLSKTSESKSHSIRQKLSNKMNIAETEAISKALRNILENAQKDSMKRNAIWMIGNIKDEESVDRLIDYLDSDNEETSILTATTLGKIGEPAVKDLIKAAKSKDYTKKKMAIFALGKTRTSNEEAKRILETLVDSDDDEISSFASRSLSKIGGTEEWQ